MWLKVVQEYIALALHDNDRIWELQMLVKWWSFGNREIFLFWDKEELNLLKLEFLNCSLGAKHDGENNDCLISDHYIMMPMSGRPDSLNYTNIYRFSPCSIEEIYEEVSDPSRYIIRLLFLICSKTFLKCEEILICPKFIESSATFFSECLLSLTSQYNQTAISTYLQELPGQRYDIHEQCKTAYGENSYYCGVRTCVGLTVELRFSLATILRWNELDTKV